jgi:transposase-like protein
VVALGRRGIKEYRAPEALILIAADREHKPLVCPSCGSDAIVRTPPRNGDDSPGGRVTLRCSACSRSAVYIDRVPDRLSMPEAPSKSQQSRR